MIVSKDMGQQTRPDTVVIESSRSRPGRRFMPTHELAVLPAALDAAHSLPGAHRGLLVLSEMSGPNGIPDLTAVVGSPRRLEERLACGIGPLLNEVDAAVVSVATSGRGKTVAEIGSVLGWPDSTVSRRLSSLVSCGALASSGNRITRNPALVSLGRIYALEAKVADWRAAIRQSRRYALWADNYVIVLGRANSSASEQALREVSADRGGLVVEGEWIRKPNLACVPEAKRLWASEHVVAALRG